MDIGKDLQTAYDEGYKQGRYDEKVETETKWIPCSERLPDVGVEVLTTTDWPDVLIAWLNIGDVWETEEHIIRKDDILAWMPLPEPWKDGKE